MLNRHLKSQIASVALVISALSPMAATANPVSVFNRNGHTVTMRQGTETTSFGRMEVGSFEGIQAGSRLEVQQNTPLGSGLPTGFFTQQTSSSGKTRVNWLELSGGNYSGRVLSLSVESLNEIGNSY